MKKVIVYNNEVYTFNDKNIEKVEQKIREGFNSYLKDKKIFTRCQVFVKSPLPYGAIVEFVGAYISDDTSLEDLATCVYVGRYEDKYRIECVKE